MLLPDVDKVAALVHQAWVETKLAQGLTSRRSPTTGEEQLVPYDQLSETVKDDDRILVRTVYAAIAAAAASEPVTEPRR